MIIVVIILIFCCFDGMLVVLDSVFVQMCLVEEIIIVDNLFEGGVCVFVLKYVGG